MGWLHVAAALLIAGCSATPFTVPPVDASPADAVACAPGGSDGVCAARMTHLECTDCCKCNHPTGEASFITLQVKCACGAPGACAGSCASTLCMDAGYANTPCETCIANARDGGPCVGEATQCQTDMNCQNFMSCEHLCDQDH